MNKNVSDERIKTGIRNLDDILHGGLPKGSLTVFAGPPGAGKTILSQQIVFKNATPENPGLIFQTLSEPTAKTLRYLQQFNFFDPKKLEDGSVHFVDLGDILRSEGLEQAVATLMGHVKRVKPGFVIIDSFKVFEDLSPSREALRKFSYEVAVNLMAWETTGFLLGEYSDQDVDSNPLFSINDGILRVSERMESGEQQRFIQVTKMRGTNHSRAQHPFLIDSNGLSIYATKMTIHRDSLSDVNFKGGNLARAKVGISQLDLLLGDGIPYGSSLLISGVAGTGKTLLSLEFIYRGAKEYGEKGIYISFEESDERLRAAAKGMGWDIESEIKKGNIEIITIAQTDILIEKDLQTIQEHIERIGAKRVAIDSLSVFVNQVANPQIVREKAYQLATLVQNASAVGFFVTDIPYGDDRISRFGVEETVVDGVILISSVELGLDRERYIEVYKLRNTAHRKGKFKLTIGHGGIKIDVGGAVSTAKVGKNSNRTKPSGKRK